MQYTVTEQGTLAPIGTAARAWLAKRESGAVVELVAVSAAKRRSNEQNRLYWAWCAQIEREQGWEPGAAHRWHKWRWGLALLTERHPEYRARLMAMLRHLPEAERLAAMDLVACTSAFTVDEMTRFLDAVHAHWAGEGVELESERAER